MVELGYTLSSEEHGPNTLVENAARAEEVGFDFACISDHYRDYRRQPDGFVALARSTSVGK